MEFVCSNCLREGPNLSQVTEREAALQAIRRDFSRSLGHPDSRPLTVLQNADDDSSNDIDRSRQPALKGPATASSVPQGSDLVEAMLQRDLLSSTEDITQLQKELDSQAEALEREARELQDSTSYHQLQVCFLLNLNFQQHFSHGVQWDSTLEIPVFVFAKQEAFFPARPGRRRRPSGHPLQARTEHLRERAGRV